MKKWFKECPFCANEIREKAVKCQYCWEFLPEEKKEEPKKRVKKETKECPFCMNKVDIDIEVCPFCKEELDGKKSNLDQHSTVNESPQDISSLKSSSIKMWEVLYWCYIWMFVWLWIAFLAWLTEADFVESDGFYALDLIISLSLLILLMVWSNKTYGYLLNKKVKNLRFDSTWWPTWWWICPIACLYIPFQTVKDIYNTFNKKCWIIWWWRACYLISALLLKISDADDSWFVAVLWLWFLIAEYILMINIINNINKFLQK